MAENFVTYRSSAGSGKTYTLVKEYLKLALQSSSPSYYKRILAITFTNKAAGEMKERVLKQLTVFSKAKSDGKFFPDLLVEKERKLVKELVNEINASNTFHTITEEDLLQRADKSLSHILHNYSDLAISTIDSFVHGIIRSFSRDMNLDTEFEIELDQDKVIENTVSDLLAEVGKDSQLTKLILYFVNTRIENGKSWNIIEDLRKFSKNIFKDSSQIELQKLKEITPDEFRKIRSKMYLTVHEFEAQFDEYANRILDLLKAAGLQTTDFSGSTIPNFFIKLSDNIRGKQNFLPTATLQKMMAGETKWISTKNKHLRPLLEPLKPEIIEMYNKIMRILEGEEYITYQRRKLVLKNFFTNSLITKINDIADQWKFENNTVMVSDFNQMISKIVLNNPAPFIFEKIGEHFLHILIDEFQDTSILQWQNFLPLIENSLAKGKFNMVVGDAKQAIYRWRDGEVMQFVNLPDIYKPMTQHIASISSVLTDNYLDKNLETNYRSSNEIIDFNNHLYEHLSSYLLEYEDIYKDLKQEKGKNKPGNVTVEYYSGGEKNEKNDEQFVKIIEKITQALDDGYDQKDIAILYRSNKEAKVIAEKILNKPLVLAHSSPQTSRAISILNQGLNVITSESLLLNQNLRIKLVLALLNITANPNDEKSKVTLITNLSHLDLLPISINEILHRYKSVSGSKPKKTSVNFEKFMTDFFPDYFKVNYKTQGIYEIAESFIRLFNFDTRADNYLEFFLHTIMENPTLSLVDFIDWWNEKGDKISVGESAGANGIRIMTIHKSKGLQFPIVIVPVTINKEKAVNIWLDEEAEIGLPTTLVQVIPNEKNCMITHKILEEKNKVLLDKINLMYVATTRPEDRLHLIIEHPEKPKFEEKKQMYQLLNSSLEHLPKKYLSNPSNEVRMGARETKKQQPSTVKKNHYYIQKYLSKPLNEGVQISFSKGEQWMSDEKTTEKDYGIIIHDLLATVLTKKDLKGKIEAMCQEGIIDSVIKKQVFEEISQLLKTKKMNQWFDPKNYVREKSEKELMNAQGNVLRPDKVVYFENNIDVIDFKSGEVRNSHKNQVLKYVTEIERMTKKPVNGYLVYTKTKEIIPVKHEAQLSMF